MTEAAKAQRDEAWIRQAILEYSQDGPDRTEEWLASGFEWVAGAVEKARRIRRERDQRHARDAAWKERVKRDKRTELEAERVRFEAVRQADKLRAKQGGSFFVTPLQPRAAEAEEDKPEAAEPDPAPAANPALQASPVAKLRRRENEAGFGEAKAEPIVEPIAEPEPEPPAAPEAKAPVVLRPDAPFDNAAVYVREHCKVDDVSNLHFWKKEFWGWNGECFQKVSDEEMNHRLWEFLDQAKRSMGMDGLGPFRPKPAQVGGLLSALEAGVFLPEKVEPPVWLKKAVKGMEVAAGADGIIAFRNRLIDIETGRFMEHSPRLWNHHSLGFDYVEGAEAPRWVQYLEEVLPGDEEAQNFLEEYGGYGMTWETKLQKAALLHGKPRAGKGTYAQIMEEMVGEAHTRH